MTIDELILCSRKSVYTSLDSVHFSVCDTRVPFRLQNSRTFASERMKAMKLSVKMVSETGERR